MGGNFFGKTATVCLFPLATFKEKAQARKTPGEMKEAAIVSWVSWTVLG